MSQPPTPQRPSLSNARKNSRVRFYRTDMSPVPTTASDSTHYTHVMDDEYDQPRHELGHTSGPGMGGYDLNSYPSFGGGEEMSLAESRDERGVDHRKDKFDRGQSQFQMYYNSHPPPQAQGQVATQGQSYRPVPQPTVYNPPPAPDGYTNTPPRVGSRIYPSPRTGATSTLDPILSADTANFLPDNAGGGYNTYEMDVSPRNSTFINHEQPPVQTMDHLPARASVPNIIPDRGSIVTAAPPRSASVQPQSGSPAAIGTGFRPLRSAMAGGRAEEINRQVYGSSRQFNSPSGISTVTPDETPSGRAMVDLNVHQVMGSCKLAGSPQNPNDQVVMNTNSPRWDTAPGARQTPRQSATPDVFQSPVVYPRYENPYVNQGSPAPPYHRPSVDAVMVGPGGWRPAQLDLSAAGDPGVVGQGALDRERGDSRLNSDTTLAGSFDSSHKYKSKLSPQPDNNIRQPNVMNEIPNSNSMRRRTTSQIEGGALSEADDHDHNRGRDQNDDDDSRSYHVKGGVFSTLLKLTNVSAAGMRRRQSSRASMGGGGQTLPTMRSLGLKRSASIASTTFGVEELDPDDPRVTGKKKPMAHRRSSVSDFLFHIGDPRERKSKIKRHVADILTRQNFILKLAKALMSFGAPSHRIESQLSATALVLEIDAQFIHLPSIVIASFGDSDTRTSDTHFVKSGGGLDLGRLHRVHNIYRGVVHDEIDAAEGTRQIHELLKAPLRYRLWQRIIMAFCASAMVSPVAFDGSPLDGLAAGCLAIILAFLQLHVATRSSMYSNIFEISIATLISFVARGLSTTGYFCYEAVASAGVCLILPGYTILCGSLELANKNIVAGSVRMVYAIIYSLFLGFGLSIGSDLFFVLDPASRAAADASSATASGITMTGTFIPDLLNSTLVPYNGTWTFSNDTATNSLAQGTVTCLRDPEWPWWRQSMPRIYLLLTVPLFSVLNSMWNMQPLRSKQLPVMVIISCVGYATNTLANHYIFNRSDVVSAIGAFVIGLMGNFYSRVFGGTAFTSMVPGVLFLVPSGIAAAGGLAMSSSSAQGDLYSQGLTIGFRMVQVAIGITVGLFGSGILIYSFGRKKGTALFAF